MEGLIWGKHQILSFAGDELSDGQLDCRVRDFNVTSVLNWSAEVEFWSVELVSWGQVLQKKHTKECKYCKKQQITQKVRAINWLYLVNREISMINTKVGWYGNHIISFTALQRKSMQCVKWLMLIFQSTTWRLVGMEFTLLASNNPTQKLVAMDYSMNNYKVGLHWMMVSYAYTAAWISLAKFI